MLVFLKKDYNINMKIVLLRFNDVLRNIKKKYNFSYEKLADILKCSISTVRSYLITNKNVDVNKAISLKEYLEKTYHLDFYDEFIFLKRDEYYYHGSKRGIVGEITHNYSNGRKNIDFGPGFYLGETFKQSSTFVAGEDGQERIYKISFNLDGLKSKYLEGLDWIFFIGYNRGKIPQGNRYSKLINKMKLLSSKDYDVIFGDIADDKMAMNMEDFFSNRLTLEQLEKCLKQLDIGKQYCLRTQKAIDNLDIVEEYILDDVYRHFVREYAINKRNAAVEETLNVLKTTDSGLRFEDLLNKYANE